MRKHCTEWENTCFTEVAHFDAGIAFVLPAREFLFQRIQVFRHKDELLPGRILAFMIFANRLFYLFESTFMIASSIHCSRGDTPCPLFTAKIGNLGGRIEFYGSARYH